MQKKKKIGRLYFVAIPVVLFILLMAFRSMFRYTAVAEIKESLTAVDQKEPLAYGKVLFETRGCIGCHAITPDIESFGPNLSGLSQRSTAAYIRQSIVDPNAVLVEGFSDITMPNFGEILNDSQIEALVTYVLSID